MWKLLAASVLLLLVAFWFYPTDDKLDTIKGKRVLITGASQGIGEELAYKFAKYGASTVITARRQQVLEKVVQKCKSIGSPGATHTAISGDMLDLEFMSNLIEKSVAQLGGLDIVVMNHVAPYHFGNFDESKKSLEKVYITMDINFKSYIELTSAVLPHLTRSKGGLVVINSVSGVLPTPLMASYSASKFALNGFFESLRNQFIMEKRNVSITSCILGAISTFDPNDESYDPTFRKIRAYFNPAPVDDTARAIVGASARREDILYYPSIVRVAVFFYKMFPSASNYVTRYLYMADSLI